MELLATRFIEAMILPPGSTLALLLLGLLIRRRLYRTGQAFIYTGITVLVLAGTPLIANHLIRLYETIPPLSNEQIKSTSAQAIVLLGGGRYTAAPEYQADTVSRHTLERARYAAYLHLRTKLPILVSGGKVYGPEAASEAELLQQVLEGAFLTPVRWLEDRSRTTYENAQFSQAMLAEDGVQHVLLVTHALHMPRSLEAFEQAGLRVTPAAMGYHTPSARPLLLDLLPSSDAISNSNSFMHELFGRAWYWLRYYAWTARD